MISVLTIDDHPLFRQGIRHLLQDEDEIDPLAEAGSVDEALQWLETHTADVVLLDHNLVGMNGVDAIPQLFSLRPDVQIIVLTVCDDHEVFLQAIRYGACGYMLKDTSPERIIEAIKAASTGECRVSDTLVRTLFERVEQSGPKPEQNRTDHQSEKHKSLSPREMDILTHLVKGMSNKEIARALNISPNTVRNQLQKLQDTFSARNRVQLALFAYDMGIELQH